ncbi:MAG: hypothetical protein R2867_47185 [Caldilineaceae bacterium]
MQQDQTKRATMKQRWNATQLSKGVVVWICLAMIAGTMLVGFTWGGWVTESTSQRSAAIMANDAMVQRLSAICVAQFQQDPAKAEKLVELKDVSSYQQGNYVRDQGWSIMPGDEQSDTKVATACGRVLAQME